MAEESAHPRRFWAVLLPIAGAWLVAARWLVPRLIAYVHAGHGPALLLQLMAGRSQVPVEAYLESWYRFSTGITIVVTAALVATRLSALVRPPVKRLARALGGAQVSTAQTLLLAVWFGAVAGLGEAIHLTARHVIVHHLARGFSWARVWMAPLSAGLSFLVAGVVLVGAVWLGGGSLRRAPVLPLKLVVSAFATIAFFSVLQSPHFGLYPAASITLCAGFGVVCARATNSYPAAIAIGVRRSSMVIAVVLAVSTTIGVRMLPVNVEARVLAHLPEARAGAPNVLLLILDTVRAASLSLYGYGRPTTPNLEHWAQRGVVFDWAIATAPWTLPSHASVFTGRYPRQLSATAFTPLDASCPTVAETLSRSGLLTGGFTGNWAFTTRISGLARGFARYEDYPLTWGRFLVSSWFSRTLSKSLLPLNRPPWRVTRKDAASNTDDFLRWLSRHNGRRFFAFLNFIDAHDPYFTAPSRIRRQFPPFDPPILSAREHVTEAELASTRAAYEASIAFIDEEIGRLLTELERREILDQTMVIITSDHGEHFGEHGLQFHGNSLYLPLLHVPLMILYPPLYPSGARVAVPVSIRDIAPSILESQGGAGVTQIGGRPLSRFFAGVNGVGEGREPILIETDRPLFFKPWQPVSKGAMKSLLAYPYHYIVEGDGRVELYDVESDYEERDDLSRSPAGGALAARLSLTLDSLISRNQRLSRETCRSQPRLIAAPPETDRSAR